jgi:hypothetical protein
VQETLRKGYEEFTQIYGDEESTHNVHQTKHLVTTVEGYGPLWCYSLFPFEDSIGKITKVCNRTTYVFIVKMITLHRNYLEQIQLSVHLNKVLAILIEKRSQVCRLSSRRVQKQFIAWEIQKPSDAVVSSQKKITCLSPTSSFLGLPAVQKIILDTPLVMEYLKTTPLKIKELASMKKFKRYVVDEKQYRSEE